MQVQSSPADDQMSAHARLSSLSAPSLRSPGSRGQHLSHRCRDAFPALVPRQPWSRLLSPRSRLALRSARGRWLIGRQWHGKLRANHLPRRSKLQASTAHSCLTSRAARGRWRICQPLPPPPSKASHSSRLNVPPLLIPATDPPHRQPDKRMRSWIYLPGPCQPAFQARVRLYLPVGRARPCLHPGPWTFLHWRTAARRSHPTRHLRPVAMGSFLASGHQVRRVAVPIHHPNLVLVRRTHHPSPDLALVQRTEHHHGQGLASAHPIRRLSPAIHRPGQRRVPPGRVASRGQSRIRVFLRSSCPTLRGPDRTRPLRRREVRLRDTEGGLR